MKLEDERLKVQHPLVGGLDDQQLLCVIGDAPFAKRVPVVLITSKYSLAFSRFPFHI